VKMDRYESAKWDALARSWNNFLSPCRPDQEDLKIIRKLLQQRISSGSSSQKLLVLGSTPEFRDLVPQLGIDVTIIDQNQSMVEFMQRLQLAPNVKETVVLEDWFSYLPRVKQQFDVILCDLTQSNIPYEKREEFYSSIASALIPGGEFIDRIYKYDEPSMCVPLETIVDKIESSNGCDLVTMNEILYWLLISDRVLECRLADLGQLYHELVSIGNYRKVHRAAEYLQEYLAPGSVTWWWGTPWNILCNDYPGSLSLAAEFRRQDALRRGFPCLQRWVQIAG
jgi:Methyltransferase domain